MTLTRVQSLQRRIQQWLDDPQRNTQDLRGLARLSEPLLADLVLLTDETNLLQKQNLHAYHAQLQSNAGRLLGVSALAVVLVLVLITTLVLQNRRRARAQEASHKLTEYFRETQLRAESASRGKSRFLANMSHELRTPFNGIFGMLSLLGTTSLNDTQADYLKTANASANHLLNVLNDILDLSALEEGKISLQVAPLDLHQLVQDVADVMRPQAEQKKLTFQVEIASDVPPWIHADPKRLKQILFNLSNNAVKFTNFGGIHIRVKTRTAVAPQARKQAMLVIEVEDTGIGISHEAIKKLFQRFNQVHNGDNEYGGTGLGLEISQSLARLMDGEIEVVSTPRVGSCFSLRLRLLPAKAPAPVPERRVFQADAPPKPERVYRVLVVEDNEVNRKFVDILLKRMGYMTFFAENGAVAIERLKRQSFDLILMDLHMPVMNGIEATRTIRALQHPAARTPIIALTADVMNDAHEEALIAGVNDFVTKPVHLGRLQEAIRLQLDPEAALRGTPS